ncbi:aspartate carbamoyltransferase [Laceyella sacchari]|jgi:aspartate carbamoyltransferase catalytic subunit|uniref:aspartate carbamoyltransferase catalytic subunit n=1 Tax=Laceyella sacchari TaxID=37482 RepID=UPI001044E8C7|nr:aspartate carbamoyltransferase catalytic subunit [Laceyella sacchari]TCW37529.1 aspartate carbamoyltransferase [Laceyella sacchari]
MALMTQEWKREHLLDTSQLTLNELKAILARARYWEENWRPGMGPYRGRFAANLFFEPSTRTRFSFEVAEKKLGMEVVNFTPDVSSTAKGESLYDTVKTLASLGVEVAVIRHSDPEQMKALARQEVGCKILNAGAGHWAHPTQALLDLYTMLKHFGDLSGKTVAIVGDIAHSRVVHSNMWSLKRFGAHVILSGPQAMRDRDCEREAPYVPFEDALQTADVVMMLRVQLERHQEKLFTSKQDYHERYGLTLQRLRLMKPEAIIMHPGPFNRGVEVADEVVEHPRSKIFEQKSNGVWIRMAVLEHALEGEKA